MWEKFMDFVVRPLRNGISSFFAPMGRGMRTFGSSFVAVLKALLKGVLVIAVIAGAIAVIAIYSLKAVVVILGILTGAMILVAAFMITAPLYATLLVNNPGGSRKSGFHLFTLMAEGEMKIIERGE